jgi:hypothetical protein
MWTWGGGNWPDKLAQKPWWNNMGLLDTDNLAVILAPLLLSCILGYAAQPAVKI